MILSIDNGQGSKTINDPSWTQIEESLKKIDKNACCFFILTADDGSYLQCAGGQVAVTLEFREVLDGKFKHFVLGKGPVTSALKTLWSTIECRVGPIKVHEDEVLNLDDAIRAFAHYFEHFDILSDLKKRDVTKHFNT